MKGGYVCLLWVFVQEVYFPVESLTTPLSTTSSIFGYSSTRTSYRPIWGRRTIRKAVLSKWQENPSIQDLPIMDTLYDILESLRQKPNLLLEAPPGAGKTTIVPLALLSSNDNILVVEPRRVAVRSAAIRMASLLDGGGESVGQTVGYAMRGESKLSSKRTKITVVTDGVFLNKIRSDPELKGVDAVVLDEFHERGVGSDTSLALCREAQKLLRPDLKLIVMSATLLGDDDSQLYSQMMLALGGKSKCNVVQSEGRQYPIDIVWANDLSWKGVPYLPLGRIMRDRKALTDIMCYAIEQAIPKSNGDILVFLPGAAEIRRVVQQLQSQRGSLKSMDILPLYGALPREEQDRAIFPSPEDSRRRIIVSSPIAEASLTLKGVTCVVDSGLRREPRCDADTGMPRLVTTRCSQASATQRAGRAGRLQPGVCVRIYGENEFQTQFLEHSPPEIKSTDLAPTVLLLVGWGCSSKEEILTELPFVDPPDKGTLDKAVQLLVDLDLLENREGRLVMTNDGHQVSEYPTHPRFASTFVRSQNNPAQLAGAVAAAFLLDDETATPRGTINSNLAERVQELYQDPKGSDLLLKYASRMSSTARMAVESVLGGNIDIRDVLQSLGLAVLPGFVDLVAERKGDASYGGSTYLLSLGRSARLDDIRDVSLQYLVVLGTSTGDDGKARIRSFVPIAKSDLLSVAVEHDVTFAVPSRGYEVRAKRVTRIGSSSSSSLELASTPLPAPPADEVVPVLKKAIQDMGGAYTALTQTMPPNKRQRLDALLTRLQLAQRHEDNMPTFTTQGDFDALLDPWWAASGSSIRSLKDLDLLTIVESSLSVDQVSMLEKYYPESITAPDGSRIPLLYQKQQDGEDEEVIVLAKAKLQQFFGTLETPTVGATTSSIPVVLQLLSPSNSKILAQTSDLPFFWQHVYPDICKEMKGRYPKHPWPTDPLQAIPTRQTNAQLRNSNQQQDAEDDDNSNRRKKKTGRKRKKK
eukprot:scaffold12324_cov144-Cylindrotheca_fusiformis.AAC.7